MLLSTVSFFLVILFSTGLEDDKREEAKEQRDSEVYHDLVVLGLEGGKVPGR